MHDWEETKRDIYRNLMRIESKLLDMEIQSVKTKDVLKPLSKGLTSSAEAFAQLYARMESCEARLDLALSLILLDPNSSARIARFLASVAADQSPETPDAVRKAAQAIIDATALRPTNPDNPERRLPLVILREYGDNVIQFPSIPPLE